MAKTRITPVADDKVAYKADEPPVAQSVGETPAELRRLYNRLLAFLSQAFPLQNAFPSILEPASGADIVPGPLTIRVATNRNDIVHRVKVWQIGPAGALTQVGTDQVVSFNGANEGSVEVTIPDPGAAGAQYFVDVVPDTGTQARVQIDIEPTVPPELTVQITASTDAIVVGTPVTFTGAISGGNGNYEFTWRIPGVVTNTTDNPFTHTFTAAGTFRLRLMANDTSPDMIPGVAVYGPFTVT